jgi:hypothetical protein
MLLLPGARRFPESKSGGLRGVRRGRLVLIAVDEVRRWLEMNAARTLE